MTHFGRRTMRNDAELLDHILNHIDNGTTDLGDEEWFEPVDHYASQTRFDAERRVMRRLPIPFCPVAALPEPGSYVARHSAGVPIVVVRDMQGTIRAFRNACRHRGMQLAEGSGCTKIFRCNYHGWAYRLDGRLEYVPHEHGFPDLDKDSNGLVPVHSVDVQSGLVFVTQDEPIGLGALESLPALLSADQVIFETQEKVEEINWKLTAEGTLEGYHIKPTHPESFFPYGYDNLNVVEMQGPNVRVCYPFRRIETLRDAPRENLSLDRMVTLVNRIFPFTSVTRLAQHYGVSFAEPESPTRTRYFNYRLTLPTIDGGEPSDEALARAKKDVAFLSDTGDKEDAKVVCDIQAAIESGANSHYRFGRFESAIGHLHKNLALYLARLETLEGNAIATKSGAESVASDPIRFIGDNK
ncbi:MAG: aromatic ring-hydroxylating dioxygenase subunit alpha [Gammaproteobacteria bacterium TMED243]|nr:(2Fe-2S)-binding protein [Gammaproteobacteria bacterium]RPG29651.1 MAG: aromatic ring-hydroxylating dioxygenase subunit alpha [Gammaproteobacteria bacterium TMED243]